MRRRLSAVVVFVLVTGSAAWAAHIPAKPTFAPGDPNAKITSALLQTLTRLQAAALVQGVPSARIARQFENPLVRINTDGELHVYLKMTATGATIRSELEQRGARIESVAEDLMLISAWVLPDRLREVAAHPAVRYIRPVGRPVTRAGNVMSQGDAILGADLVRALGYDGTGIKVGVISDDVDHMSAAQASGDLPTNITVLRTNIDDGDEGTAMLEIVHDLAPGAELYFRTGTYGSDDMRDGILELANAGCSVIVDDIGWFDQPFFEDGYIAQTVDEVTARGVVYCSAAGNDAEVHYQGLYVPANGVDGLHAWDGGSDSTFRIDIPPEATVTVVLQWDSPWQACTDDYDMYLYDDVGLTQLLDSSNTVQSGVHEPYEAFVYTNPNTFFTKTAYLTVHRRSGEARRLELFILGAEYQEYQTPSGSVFGHPAARGAIAVGAINADEPGNDEVANYSSQGPSYIRYPYAESRMKPDLCGIDGVSVTGAGGFSNPFHGTSAAAPHVAAVAALLRQAHPNWSPADVRQALTSTAYDLGQVGPDNISGAGRVRAREAVGVQYAGPTNVRGNITTTTWTKANSPYRVIALVRVLAGHTLTIEPGVDVLFDADAQFLVEGSIRAIGTETDSIRFLKGVALEWGGLRFTGGKGCDLHYVRISGGRADGIGPENWGGGIFAGDTSEVSITHSVISANRSSMGGGGLCVMFGSILAIERCVIDGNSAGLGGGLYIEHASVSAGYCQFANNYAGQGGGVYAGNGTNLQLARVTLAKNNSYGDRGQQMECASSSHAVLFHCTLASYTGYSILATSPSAFLLLTNCTVWRAGGGGALQGDNITATYSNICGNYPGIGNFNADPMFLDPANGDYRLQWSSPCIDMGDPDSPRDPDGTIADIGAFYFDQSGLTEMLQLPNIEAFHNQAFVVRVRATLHDVRALDLAFTLPANLAEPDTPFVRFHAYQGQTNAQVSYSVRGDTVRVSFSGTQGISLSDEVLVELAFAVRHDAPVNTVGQLVWLPYPNTNIQEKGVNVIHGALTVLPPPVLYGDVSDDGTVSTFDASMILQYVVNMLPSIDSRKADVTNNGTISSYDAALVLYRVINPAYRFPVEGGHLPRPAARAACALSWQPTGNGWVPCANDATGIMAGDLVLTLANDTPVQIGDGVVSACRQDGRTLYVSFVREATEGNTLLSLITSSGTAPEVAEISLNEGTIPTVLPAPVPFSLSQNTPNPFNPSTTLRFALPEAGHVTLAVYDVNGRLVRTLVGRTFLSGRHEVVWDGCDDTGREVASGVYVCRLTAAQGVLTKRMVLVR